MVADVAPVVDHERLTLPPGFTRDGNAENALITGTVGAGVTLNAPMLASES